LAVAVLGCQRPDPPPYLNWIGITVLDCAIGLVITIPQQPAGTPVVFQLSCQVFVVASY